ncbi:MAG: S8 family serine peptidase [Oscillospiraceae bacterium]|jgi:subtilisin family serine protease|nr:S8 family serine peptidase [Oscillospiraceae bacterium]
MDHLSKKMKQALALILAMLLVGSLVITAMAADGGVQPPEPPGGNSDALGNNGFVPGEVLAPADSQEEAEMIAAAYGLALKSYSCGIAVMSAPNPEQAVVQSRTRSQTKGFATFDAGVPQLSLNRIYTLYEPVNEGELLITEDFGDAQWHHKEIDTRLAWGVSKGGGVIIAIIDTGIDITHPKFDGKILENSYNSHSDQVGIDYVKDVFGHGTHVCGIAAALMNGDPSVCGVAPDAKILVIKSDMADGSGNTELVSVLRGLNYAVENGASVVNLSMGRPYAGGIDKLEQSTIADAVAKGVTVVCAVGNSRAAHAAYPAAYPETIAVSATKQGGLFDSGYSNYGPEIDVAAPGGSIWSTRNGGGYETRSGTSMASPSVVGIAALIKSSHPGYTPEQIRDVISKTAISADPSGWDKYLGYGIVNAYAALLGSAEQCNVTGKIKSYNPQNATKLQLLQDGEVVCETEIKPEDGLGQTEQSFTFTNVLPGTYTLYITKVSHTSFKVQNIIVGDTDLDLTKDTRDAVQCMTLLCGDINGDGMINNADLAVLWMAANYNRNTKQAAEPLCDLDGDGMINSADLAILWMAANYNKGAVVVN